MTKEYDEGELLHAAPVASRPSREIPLQADLAIAGGGLAGTCCAITAARQGLKVVLVQDRPVLGGNSSSEVRLWVLGATVHMGLNNRWVREGGVVNEVLVENLWRNREGNPVIFDTILLEKARAEENLTLLLNTAAFEVEKEGETISSLRAFCSQNSTFYRIKAPFFCDATGDGLLAFQAGAAFRMGAEPREEFDEPFAPDHEFGGLLGHSIYFYTKDTGRPVRFVPPAFALKDIPQHIPRHHMFNSKTQGCALWWIEHGGRLDTVHESEQIKWELWRIVYGVWDYIKNSGKYPDAGNLTLEWVGMIPGKRESRRFEGDHILRQQDVISREPFEDGVAFGGWSIDLHPADGVYAERAGAHHLHTKGIYTIPYRCYYSRNVSNLFLAGRIISSSHVAFGSTRVMATCAHGGQAVAVAAAECLANGWNPRDLLEPSRMKNYRQRLLKTGHHLPGVPLENAGGLAHAAKITASSELVLAELPGAEKWMALKKAMGQLLPLPAGEVPRMTVRTRAASPQTLKVRLATSSDHRHHTPDVTLAQTEVEIAAGEQEVTLPLKASLGESCCVYWIFEENPQISLHLSETRVTGIVNTLFRTTFDVRELGGERFDVFRVERRPGGQNLAFKLDPAPAVWSAESVLNGYQRPTHQPNAWVAALDDPEPELRLDWPEPQEIQRITLSFDVDYDHAMESVLRGHPENAVPFCVRHFQVLDADGRLIAGEEDWHQARFERELPEPVRTAGLRIKVLSTWGAPAAIQEVRVE